MTDPTPQIRNMIIGDSVTLGVFVLTVLIIYFTRKLAYYLAERG